MHDVRVCVCHVCHVRVGGVGSCVCLYHTCSILAGVMCIAWLICGGIDRTSLYLCVSYVCVCVVGVAVGLAGGRGRCAFGFGLALLVGAWICICMAGDGARSR